MGDADQIRRRALRDPDREALRLERAPLLKQIAKARAEGKGTKTLEGKLAKVGKEWAAGQVAKKKASNATHAARQKVVSDVLGLEWPDAGLALNRIARRARRDPGELLELDAEALRKVVDDLDKSTTTGS